MPDHSKAWGRGIIHSLWHPPCLGSAESNPQGGISWQHGSGTRAHTAQAPAWILCISPAVEELLQSLCRKTWEITCACDISN